MDSFFEPTPAIETAPKVILLLEDDLIQAKSIDAFLRRHGFDTVVCHRGEDAVALAAAEKPDFMVADLAMDGMNGSEAVARIAADPECAGIGIVFLSALSPQTDDDAIGSIKINGRAYQSVSKGSLARRLIPAIEKLSAGR